MDYISFVTGYKFKDFIIKDLFYFINKVKDLNFQQDSYKVNFKVLFNNFDFMVKTFNCSLIKKFKFYIK